MNLTSEQITELVTAVQLIKSVQDDSKNKVYNVDVAINNAEIHLQLDVFLETFGSFETETNTGGDYPFEAFVHVNGVRFKALVHKTEVDKLGLLKEVI